MLILIFWVLFVIMKYFFNLLVKIDADSNIWGFICNNEVFLEGC